MDEEQFRAGVRAWLAANAPGDPGFILPQNMLAVATREQPACLATSRPAFGDATHHRRWIAEHLLAHAQ